MRSVGYRVSVYGESSVAVRRNVQRPGSFLSRDVFSDPLGPCTGNRYRPPNNNDAGAVPVVTIWSRLPVIVRSADRTFSRLRALP